MGDKCEFINLDGKTLLPGFIDCHLHPMGFINHTLRPDVANLKNLDELLEYLKVESVWFEKDEFIMAYNLNEEIFDKTILPTLISVLILTGVFDYYKSLNKLYGKQ